MQSEIKRWGNSAAIRLPIKILSQVGMGVSSPVRIKVKAGKIVIESIVVARPKFKLPFSEADLLVGLDAYTAHTDGLVRPSNEEVGNIPPTMDQLGIPKLIQNACMPDSGIVTGIISQCEIGEPGYGANIRSFPEAVRNAMRRHPDVVLIGEAHDKETIDGAVSLAMTGLDAYTAHTDGLVRPFNEEGGD